MINGLSISGYKCFDKVKLEPKQINILAGKNSAGKSSIIQAIIALKQGGYNPFRGDYIKMGEISELMNVYIGADTIEIEAEYDSYGKNKKAMINIHGLNAKVSETELLDMELVYCSAERVGVKEAYERAPEDNDTVGVDCRYAFSYFCKHKEDKFPEEEVYDTESLLTFDGQVNYWLNTITGCKINAYYIPKTDLVGVEYSNAKRVASGIWSRPQNVGTGVTYIASVIIAALSCRKGGALIIENPEIHLHPAAQSVLLEFLAFMSLRGIQIFIETHSDHVFNGLRKCVHNNLILSNSQAIYFFRDVSNNCSEPVLIALDDSGKICNREDGLFDQIQKDLDVILDW